MAEARQEPYDRFNAASLLREIERLQRHINLAFHAACGGDAHQARVHLTDARWGHATATSGGRICNVCGAIEYGGIAPVMPCGHADWRENGKVIEIRARIHGPEDS